MNKKYSKKVEYITINCLPPPEEIKEYHNISEQNKEYRMSIAASLLSLVNIKPFLNTIILGHEKWVTYDNIVHKRQWLIKNQQPLPD